MDRRRFLSRSATGLAAGVALAGPAASGGVDGAAAVPPASEGPWALLAPLRPGADLGLGWRLTDLEPPFQGRVELGLAHQDGRAVRVWLCRRQGEARGPASTRHLELLVMDGGHGDQPTDESMGRALRHLAAVVAANEDGTAPAGVTHHHQPHPGPDLPAGPGPTGDAAPA